MNSCRHGKDLTDEGVRKIEDKQTGEQNQLTPTRHFGHKQQEKESNGGVSGDCVCRWTEVQTYPFFDIKI
jgi:hypothetical protein